MRFETARLRMRQTTPEEAREIFEDGQIPPGLRFAEGYPTEGTMEVMDLLAGPRSALALGFRNYFILRKDDQRVIGDIGSSPADEPGVMRVGYGVAPSVEGHGYATEALVGLLAHLFGAGQRVVRADTLAEHRASRRVMEKAGMEFVREFEGEKDGEPARMALYEARGDSWRPPQ